MQCKKKHFIKLALNTKLRSLCLRLYFRLPFSVLTALHTAKLGDKTLDKSNDFYWLKLNFILLIISSNILSAPA